MRRQAEEPGDGLGEGEGENRGSGGVDGQSLAAFEAQLGLQLARLRRELEEDAYQPLPVRQHPIPKRDKPGEYRMLGIPAIYDRVCQQALLNRLEPIFEPVFDDASFGYRRGRSTKDALRKIWKEILDPENLTAGWTLGPTMKYARGYHSSAILLPDGSVLMGGGEPEGATVVRPLERYFPGYFFKPRPSIVGVPVVPIGYGATFKVDTPNAASIAEVVLLRPGAVTHGFNQSQRFVGCAITAVSATSIDAKAPPDSTYAPPGWYLLFLVDGGRVPSVARWIRLH